MLDGFEENYLINQLIAYELRTHGPNNSICNQLGFVEPSFQCKRFLVTMRFLPLRCPQYVLSPMRVAYVIINSSHKITNISNIYFKKKSFVFRHYVNT